MRRNNVRPWKRVALLATTLLCFFCAGSGVASPAAKLASSGESLELEYTGEAGATLQETIPVYHAGAVRYFSTGVGLEERAAHYPPFPLKVVFIVGPRAYLSQVAVTITDKAGKTLLDVPGDKVTGPWLFVDLPPGSYGITATSNQAAVKARATITAGQTQTVYIRWKEGG